MKTLIVQALILTLIFTFTDFGQLNNSAQSTEQTHKKFDPKRDAQKDLQMAIAQAQKENKRILLDVGGEWCIWCHRLDSLFLMNDNLNNFLNTYYIVVKVNVSKENRNEKFLLKYPPIAGYPHLFVLNKNGKLLHSQDTGELEYPKDHPVKGHNKAKVFAFLRKWAK